VSRLINACSYKHTSVRTSHSLRPPSCRNFSFDDSVTLTGTLPSEWSNMTSLTKMCAHDWEWMRTIGVDAHNWEWMHTIGNECTPFGGCTGHAVARGA
jgi:hypothetical protein